MVKPELHLLQIEREMTPTDAMILPQAFLGVAPEPFNAVDVPDVAATSLHVGLSMVHGQMFAIPPQRFIAAEAIRIEDRPLEGPPFDLLHERGLIGLGDDHGAD